MLKYRRVYRKGASYMQNGSSQSEIAELYSHTLDHLREKGVRLTDQRKALIKYLITSHAHPTVEEIYNDLQDEAGSMSLATIYNNLRVLVDAGIVYEMKFTDVSSRFDFIRHKHYHIICTNCGKVADFEVPDVSGIKQQAREQTGYVVNEVKLELYGICPECARKAEN